MIFYRILFSFILFTCIESFNSVFGQTKSDLELIKEQNFKDDSYSKKRKVTFLFTKSKSAIVRYNPLSISFGGMMYVYQKFISVQIGADCPYEISCSAFSKQCIQKLGLIKGMALSADRLMCCTRLASVDIKLSDINEQTMHIIDSPNSYQSSKKSTSGK